MKPDIKLSHLLTPHRTTRSQTRLTQTLVGDGPLPPPPSEGNGDDAVRLRVLHVIPTIDAKNSYGGPVAVCTDIVNCLADRYESRVSLLSTYVRRNGKPNASSMRPSVTWAQRSAIQIPSMGPGWTISLGVLTALPRLLANTDVMHIHGSREPLNILAATMALIGRTPTVIQTHGMQTNQRPIPLLDILWTQLLRRAERTYALNTDEAKILASKGVQNVEVLTNAVPERSVSIEAADAESTQPRGAVLFCGRLEGRKRVKLFLDISRHLPATSDRPHVVIGADEGDGELVRQWQYQSKHHHWTGGLPLHLARAHIANASCLVVTAENEPFGMTIAEALVSGTPVICTPGVFMSGELSEADAAIVTRADPNALADAISSLTQNRATQLIEHGRMWLSQRPSLEDLSTQLTHTYTALALPSGRPLEHRWE